MKNLFSKSLMMAAAAMMFVSCSNEEDVVVNPYEGKTSDVTIAMSVAGVGSKASADEVNMGTSVQNIKNAVIVPMVGDAYQTPIVFDSEIEAGAGKVSKKVKTLPQTVNRFRVYGNATATTAKETAVFKSTDLTFTVGAEKEINSKKFYAPHGLYYYLDTKDNGYKAANNASWDAVDWSGVTANSNALGENNCVKVDGVKYAVGVLAAAVSNGDATTTFYDTDPTSGSPAGQTWQGGEVKVTGVLVYDQSNSFNDSFVASGKTNVYETAAVETITDNKVSDGARTNGNIYCVVAPTTENTVTLNIEFEAVKYFRLADGTVVDPGTKLYLPVVLDKTLATGSGATEIFEAAKATFLNAKVMNWGLASETPIESTDVTIGVEFDAEWDEGLNFDIEI